MTVVQPLLFPSGTPAVSVSVLRHDTSCCLSAMSAARGVPLDVLATALLDLGMRVVEGDGSECFKEYGLGERLDEFADMLKRGGCA